MHQLLFISIISQAGLGEVTLNSIPIGDFFKGPVNYLVFIQDSDWQGHSLGKSFMSGLKLVSLDTAQLEIEIEDVAEYLSNNQVSYTTNGNTPDYQDEEDFLLLAAPLGDGKIVWPFGHEELYKVHINSSV